MIIHKATLWTASVLLAVLGASAANAQDARLSGDRGMDLHLFRPAVDSKGHIAVDGADILGHLDFSFGLILDGGFQILKYNGFKNDENVQAADAQRSSYVVDNFLTGTLHANLGLFNLFIVGLQVPFQAVGGPNLTVPGVYNDQEVGLDFQGLGNMTFHSKFRIIRPGIGRVGLAALLRVGVPTGASSAFVGDPGVSIWPTIAAELRPISWLRMGVTAGYRFISGEGATFPIDGRTNPSATNALGAQIIDAGDSITYDDLITAGFGASFRILPSVDLIAEIYANQIVTEVGQRGAFAAETIGGFKIFVDRNSYLMLGGGVGLPTDGFSAPAARAVLSFIFEPSIGDRDGDGIKDDIDQCPDEPEDLDGFQDEDGCPEPDNDRDGIPDVDDSCPMIAEDFDGDQDEDGCPEGHEGDRDGDGIPDNIDACPDEPEDRDGFEDEDGCPDPDNDQDGILDVNDLCPNEPEDKDGFEDQDGCPDPDNDKDRIVDEDDSCPNDPEVYNGFEDEDGCPDKGSVVIEDNQIVILEKIYFETDSAEIQARSFPIVDAVAATLNGNPQIELIEIQGHADERGADDYNLKLTKDRAASVRAAMVERGVAPARVRSAGYGERCPVDKGHNAAAWDKNRRVEFKILRTDRGPTGVEIVCPAGRSLIPK